MVERHEEIVEDILKHVRPLAYFNNYLEYGYYPIYLEEKSHIDYLLKNINLTLGIRYSLCQPDRVEIFSEVETIAVYRC